MGRDAAVADLFGPGHLADPEAVQVALAQLRAELTARGVEPAEITREVERQFGAELRALGCDEVGTPSLF